MAELSREELRRLARLGAQRRLEELRREETAIRAAFPDLGPGASPSAKTGRRRRKRAASAKTGATAPAPAKRPARYKMSAAQKRAVSERMKKYWAARRKAKG